jgi:lipoate-protein ligase B
MRNLTVRDGGRDVDYAEAAEQQERLLADRIAGRIGDTLLLLEHRPVFTLGRSANAANILWSDAERSRRGIGRASATRGGDVTYHGPGQLVGYPIIHLGQAGLSLPEYVTGLEEAMIRALSAFGIASGRDARNRGVWVGNEKIAAIGIRVSRQVTMHGFALNVNTRLDDYRGIVACGVTGAGVASMAQILGHRLEMASVKTMVVRAFREVFEYPDSNPGEGREQA